MKWKLACRLETHPSIQPSHSRLYPYCRGSKAGLEGNRLATIASGIRIETLITGRIRVEDSQPNSR